MLGPGFCPLKATSTKRRRKKSRMTKEATDHTPQKAHDPSPISLTIRDPAPFPPKYRASCRQILVFFSVSPDSTTASIKPQHQSQQKATHIGLLWPLEFPFGLHWRLWSSQQSEHCPILVFFNSTAKSRPNYCSFVMGRGKKRLEASWRAVPPMLRAGRGPGFFLTNFAAPVPPTDMVGGVSQGERLEKAQPTLSNSSLAKLCSSSPAAQSHPLPACFYSRGLH